MASAQEIYLQLSSNRRVVERALVVLAEANEFVGEMQDVLTALAGKVSSGMELTYQEFMIARAQLRRELYVSKLAQMSAVKTAQTREVGKRSVTPAAPAVAVEPAWLRNYNRPVAGRHWYEPPQWINTRFLQKCARCGGEIAEGAKALWFPSTRMNSCMCKACGAAYEVAERAERKESEEERDE
jgi:hypothetical protein